MDWKSTILEGVTVIQPKVFQDERGYFYEAYSEKLYKEICGGSIFIQDNVSRSAKNTIRGLHYQIGKYAQGKLCKVILGRVLDVVVDIRFGSPTFGKHFAIELSDTNHTQLSSTIHYREQNLFSHMPVKSSEAKFDSILL